MKKENLILKDITKDGTDNTLKQHELFDSNGNKLFISSVILNNPLAIMCDLICEGKDNTGKTETLIKLNDTWLNYTMTRCVDKESQIQLHEKIIKQLLKGPKKFLEKYRGNVNKEGTIFYDVDKLKEVWKNKKVEPNEN